MRWCQGGSNYLGATTAVAALLSFETLIQLLTGKWQLLPESSSLLVVWTFGVWNIFESQVLRLPLDHYIEASPTRLHKNERRSWWTLFLYFRITTLENFRFKLSYANIKDKTCQNRDCNVHDLFSVFPCTIADRSLRESNTPLTER